MEKRLWPKKSMSFSSPSLLYVRTKIYKDHLQNNLLCIVILPSEVREVQRFTISCTTLLLLSVWSHCYTNNSGTQKCFPCPDNIPRRDLYAASPYFSSSYPSSGPGNPVRMIRGARTGWYICPTVQTRLIWAKLQNKVRKVHLSSSCLQLHKDSNNFYKYYQPVTGLE